MQENDQLLSQAEIDALVSSSPIPVEPAQEPLAFVASPPPGLGPTPVAEALGPQTSTSALGWNFDDLSQRLLRLEAAVAMLGDGGQGSAQLEETVRQLQTDFQEVTSQFEAVSAGLQGTVGYAAHENFICNTCANPGLVAAKLSCTSCGAENWWGWFPSTES